MNALRLLAAGLFALGLVAGAHAEKADPTKLVGVWEVVKSDDGGAPPVGTVIEFGKDGKMKVTHKNNGKEETVDGTYKLDGQKLTVTLKMGDKEVTHMVTIKKLTATDFAAENEKGSKAEFKRKK